VIRKRFIRHFGTISNPRAPKAKMVIVRNILMPAVLLLLIHLQNNAVEATGMFISIVNGEKNV
jgi:hypothetical protein